MNHLAVGAILRACLLDIHFQVCALHPLVDGRAAREGHSPSLLPAMPKLKGDSAGSSSANTTTAGFLPSLRQRAGTTEETPSNNEMTPKFPPSSVVEEVHSLDHSLEHAPLLPSAHFYREDAIFSVDIRTLKELTLRLNILS